MKKISLVDGVVSSWHKLIGYSEVVDSEMTARGEFFYRKEAINHNVSCERAKTYFVAGMTGNGYGV